MHASKQAASITSGANAEVHIILFLYEAHLQCQGTLLCSKFFATQSYIQPLKSMSVTEASLHEHMPHIQYAM